MGTARIFKPAKTAMQSGRANTKRWLLEFDPEGRVEVDALMGWAGSYDTNRQLKLWFSSKEDAVQFAERKELDFYVEEPNQRVMKPRAYADNFAFRRVS